MRRNRRCHPWQRLVHNNFINFQ
ncbi:hypothetical protein FRZ67_22160 [Panacibacter ginsenosidivorans]|uniref:Uncharacterized protein n=1 Tax=Panacibacter ginsenosidivorans TaxID=1813871 RepID=A0A5B8VJ54_9BACT|nr:hypothetical protein FRZ67_22160 [Panacibacter ginsenosidivorans]